MRKKFIKASVFCALAIVSSTAFVGCADYDDDINNLQEQVDANKSASEALTTQVNELKSALEAAKAEAKVAHEEAAKAIQQAQSTADEAVKAAAEAKAEAELAKQAAAEAKAEAIEEAVKLAEEIKAMIPSTDNLATNEALAKAVEDLTAQIAAVDVREELGALKDQLNGIDLDAVQTAIEQMEIQLEAVKKFEALIKENENAISDLQGKQLEIDKSIEAINSEMDKLAKMSDVVALEERVKLAEEALKNIEQNVTIVNNNLVTILGKGLRGLVFYPELFINGIEAAEYGFVRNTVMAANPTPETKGTDNEDNVYTLLKIRDGKRALDYIPGNTTADVNPYVKIAYHMNPSNAEVKGAENVKFISRNAEVIGRSTESNVGGIKANSIDTKSEKGKLLVNIQANGASLLDASENGEGTIFAAQVNAGDTVVTSDYALLYPSVIKMEHLAFNDPKYMAVDCQNGNFNDVLFDAPYKVVEFKGGAWTNPEFDKQNHPVQEPLCIPYNGSFDLKDKFQLHYSWTTPTKNATKHAVILPGEESYYGLKYEFNLVDYTIGINGTSESYYASLKDGVLKPCIVGANGLSQEDKQGPSSIGRHPLVQVLVKDTVNNVVVLDGYVQFEIIDVPKYSLTPVFEVMDKLKYAPCNGDSKQIYWFQVSDLLYEYSKMSKEEFEETYEIDEVNGQVRQYVWSGTGNPAEGEIANTFSEITGTPSQIGTIIFNRDVDPDNDGTTTNTFTWNFDGCETVKIYEAGRTHTVYVRFERVNNKISSDYRYVYLPIKVTMDPRNEKIGSMGEKIKEYWYSNNRFPAESAFTRLNVHAPKDDMSTLPFETSLTQVWNGNKINISGLTGSFAAYNPVGTNGHRFFFAPYEGNDSKHVGNSGTKYTLSVGSGSMDGLCGGTYTWDVTNNGNNDNNITTINEKAVNPYSGVFANDVVYATPEGSVLKKAIAKIHHTGTGSVEGAAMPQAPYIEYINNDYAKDLLNGYISKRLAPDGTDGAQLFFNIGVVAYDNCIVKAIKNNINPAYVVRPINIEGKADNFIDATDNGSKAYILDLFDFTDWRDQKFFNRETKDYSNAWYFAFYNVKNVKVLSDEVLTDMNQADGTYVPLKNVTSKVKLSANNVNTVELARLHNDFNKQQFGTDWLYNNYRDAIGYILYENNMDNVAEFNLKVPVSFEYDWGTIIEYVTIKVEKTMGQN